MFERLPYLPSVLIVGLCAVGIVGGLYVLITTLFDKGKR
jgi:uncharacterized membrane protein